MHEESSSSASAKTGFSPQKTEWASPGVLKVFPEDGPSFFVREVYLPFPAGRLFESDTVLDEDEFDQLFLAARTYLAEKAAMSYLGRAEHCRRQLEIKLVKKDFTEREISGALDYLEQKKYLDDHRYCEAWLRTRLIHKAEGRVKLLAALQGRGIRFETAQKAVTTVLSDEDEEELCKKAAEKLQERGKMDLKLVTALYRAGFSLKIVAKCVKNGENDYQA